MALRCLAQKVKTSVNPLPVANDCFKCAAFVSSTSRSISSNPKHHSRTIQKPRIQLRIKQSRVFPTCEEKSMYATIWNKCEERKKPVHKWSLYGRRPQSITTPPPRAKRNADCSRNTTDYYCFPIVLNRSHCVGATNPQRLLVPLSTLTACSLQPGTVWSSHPLPPSQPLSIPSIKYVGRLNVMLHGTVGALESKK